MAYKKLEYKKFRVRSSIKSFRDLDVYKNTTLLSAEIFLLKLPEKYRKKKGLQDELEKLKQISKFVPKLISESYGDKFTSLELASDKLEKSAHIIDSAITKADFLNAIIDNEDFRGKVLEIIKKYQVSRRRILNLKRAWNRVFGSGDIAKGWEKNRNIRNKYKKD